MPLTPRALRNNWWKDEDGFFNKTVYKESLLNDSVDFTDFLSLVGAATISSAQFLEVNGPTLGAPSISGGIVSFTHTGIGSAILEVTTDTAATNRVVLNFVDPRYLYASDYTR